VLQERKSRERRINGPQEIFLLNNELPASEQRTPLLLEVDPRRCTGCGMCRLICSMVKEGRAHPPLARIRLIRCASLHLHLPVICRHCEDAPCMNVCPREAIFRDRAVGRVMIDYDRCISCQMCVAACPFGAMGFDSERRTVFKCDLCDGDPQCARFCFPGALTCTAEHRLVDSRSRTAARQRLARGRIRVEKNASDDGTFYGGSVSPVQRPGSPAAEIG
jgi:Fe-S-cluster-containing hydrogenase component 2